VIARWLTLLRSIAALVAAASIATGCTDTPFGSVSGATVEPVARPTPQVGTTPGPSLPGQSSTAWGRIWDALPPWFPLPAGAIPTQTGSGPFTAELALPSGSTAAGAAAFFRSEFQKVGFPAVNLDGPLEDGRFVVSVPGSGGACQIEVQAVPLASGVVARVLYGAGCPFE
jgi:hypothetical protein